MFASPKDAPRYDWCARLQLSRAQSSPTIANLPDCLSCKEIAEEMPVSHDRCARHHITKQYTEILNLHPSMILIYELSVGVWKTLS